jgi:hypothetical protein
MTPPRSLAFREFGLRHQGEVESHLRLAASCAFAERWWRGQPESAWPATLAEGAADPASAEGRLHLTPADFLANQFHVLLWARSFALVAIITSFESYLRRALERALLVQPTLLSHFEMQITIKDLAEPSAAGDPRPWTARRVADHFIRERTHARAYRRLDEVFKCGVSKKLSAELEEWHRLTLLRNAIVHESRATTRELMVAWPDRFKQEGALVVLQDADIDRAHGVGFALAQTLDRRYASEIIGEADACDLVCKMYWGMSVKDPEGAVRWIREFLAYDLPLDRAAELQAHCAAEGKRSFP